MELWELVARESIRDCIARYNANGDRGRIDAMVEVFAPDGIMETVGRVFEGRDAIRTFFSSVTEDARARDETDTRPDASGAVPTAGVLTTPTPTEQWIARGRRPFIRHCTATTLIDVLSETEARARSYYFVLTVHGVDHWGRYVDEYGVVDGKWLITRRTEITDAVYDGGWGAAAGGALLAEIVTRPLTYTGPSSGGAALDESTDGLTGEHDA